MTAAGTRDEPALDGTSAPARCQPACHGKMPTSSQYRSTMPTTSPSHGRMPTLPFHQGAMPIMPGLPDPPHAELVLGCLLAASSDVPQSRPGAPSALHSPIPPNPKMGRKRGKKKSHLGPFALYSDLNTVAEHGKAITCSNYLLGDEGGNVTLNFKQEPEWGG